MAEQNDSPPIIRDDCHSGHITDQTRASSCGCSETRSGPPVEEARIAGSFTDRFSLLQRGLRLEYFTVGWNIIEGLVSIVAAVAAGSVALLGFGIDSFVETISGLLLIWRLRAERRLHNREEIDRLDQRVHKLVALSLFLLAAYIVFDAGKALLAQERPKSTFTGIIITSLSLVVMWWLARAKRSAAKSLGSRALKADSFQTTACFWLSLITLVGIGLNATLGWWWADPCAALGMTWFIVSEGREAWRGEDCCSCGSGND